MLLAISCGCLLTVVVGCWLLVLLSLVVVACCCWLCVAVCCSCRFCCSWMSLFVVGAGCRFCGCCPSWLLWCFVRCCY